MFYPFQEDLIWVPARNFETAYQEILLNNEHNADFSLEVNLGEQPTQFIESSQIKKPLRMFELLNESRIFARPLNTTKPYLKIKLAVKDDTFNSELSYKQFKKNMPVQLVMNLLLLEGSYSK